MMQIKQPQLKKSLYKQSKIKVLYKEKKLKIIMMISLVYF